MMKPSDSPKPASGPVFGLTWPILIAFDCALAGITCSTAGAAIAPRPPAITARRLMVVPDLPVSAFITNLPENSTVAHSTVAHGFQMRHHPGAQRRLLFRAPILEALAGFETEFAVGDKLLQQR